MSHAFVAAICNIAFVMLLEYHKVYYALLCRYVLKSQMKELLELEAKNAVSIEEEIESERKKVDAKTPITEEVLLQLASVHLETGSHCMGHAEHWW